MVRFNPVETKGGIKVMSMNLVTPVEEEPLIWRGASNKWSIKANVF